MQPADLLETHIKPYLLQHLGDADAILLAGSHARALNGETAPDATAKKNSDFDFVILYDKLPARFPAAMFASRWMYIPDLDEPVSIDLKIIDRDYLDFHARHTREIRRFPFLFSMILDAYPIQAKPERLEKLRDFARDFIQSGPAPLGHSQIADAEAKIVAFQAALDNAGTPHDHAIIALEGLQFLAGQKLLTAQDWISPIGRNLTSLRQSQCGEENRLTRAFNQVQGGDTIEYRCLSREIIDQLTRHRAAGHADSDLLAMNISALVAQAEIDDSNSKGDKIMLGQYLARMKDIAVMDDLRAIELKCVLWLTAKSYLCRRLNLTFAHGAAQVEQIDKMLSAPLLAPLFCAIIDENLPAMHRCVDDILADQGGVGFTYLERIYVEDLARRRAAQGINPATPSVYTATPHRAAPALPPIGPSA